MPNYLELIEAQQQLAQDRTTLLTTAINLTESGAYDGVLGDRSYVDVAQALGDQLVDAVVDLALADAALLLADTAAL